MKKTIGLILGLTLPLVACGGEEAAPRVEAAAPASEGAEAVAQIRNLVSEDDIAMVWAGQYLADTIVSVEQIAAEASENGILLTRVAAGEERSVGGTTGARLHSELPTLGDTSGAELTVAVTARAVDADDATFRVAYTTNHKGNSGWQEFTAGPDFETFEFSYTIREGEDPNGDYIGFTLDDGVEVEISEVRIY